MGDVGGCCRGGVENGLNVEEVDRVHDERSSGRGIEEGMIVEDGRYIEWKRRWEDEEEEEVRKD